MVTFIYISKNINMVLLWFGSVKRLSVSLDEKLHTRLKMYAVISAVTMNDVVIEALNEYLLKRSEMDSKSAEL